MHVAFVLRGLHQPGLIDAAAGRALTGAATQIELCGNSVRWWTGDLPNLDGRVNTKWGGSGSV